LQPVGPEARTAIARGRTAAAPRPSARKSGCKTLPWLRDGRLTLTKLALLRDVLSEENHTAVLERAAALPEDEVAVLAFRLGNRETPPPPRDSIRPVALAIPQPRPQPSSSPETAPVPTEPAIVLHQIKMTVGPELLRLLESVRAALSHTHPGASLETLLAHCMERTLHQHARRTKATVKTPRPAKLAKSGRAIPAAVRREVWQRDGGRCSFIGTGGRRCGATHQLELHHRIPVARGGTATPDNLTIHCRAHNDLAARGDFGDAHMDQFRRQLELGP